MYLGDVVQKCCAGEITSAVELMVAVRRAITDLGVVLGDGDEISYLGHEGLTI